jgi:RimJ/RimL family protein N-acetyltransferase
MTTSDVDRQAPRLREVFPVTTQRLRLRLFEPRDLEDQYRMQSDPDLVRYVPYEPRTREQVQAGLEERLASPAMEADGQVLRLVAERLDDGSFVGELTLVLTSVEHRQGEIGFILHREQQGHGFGTEAARELLRLGFDWLRLHRMAGICDPRNTASAALMARLGMRLEAHLRGCEWFKGEWGDLLTYAQLEDEFRSGAADVRS